MPTDSSTADPLVVLRTRFQADIGASPLCRAVLGWLCDVPTEPAVAEIGLRWGQVVLRLSDEAASSPFGTLAEFLDQIRVVCDTLGLTHGQTARVLSWARHRLG